MSSSPTPQHPLKYPNFVQLLLGRFLTNLATLTLTVALGWQTYVTARLSHSVEESSFLVGMIGLAQFLPLFAFTLPAGETADRYDRRLIVQICNLVQIFCALALAFLAFSSNQSLTPLFIIAALFGANRAFIMPATIAMAPMLVPAHVLPRGVAWNSLAMQSGMILGPWLGGALCDIDTAYAYTASAALYILTGINIWLIRANTKPAAKTGSRLALIREGLAYVWSNKIVFGAISLDLFAVLLGGATALLPVYARDILQIGPGGFGLLRSGPALGGGLMALWFSFRPIQRHAGTWMLGAVLVFGLATICFAYSKIIWLSLIALATLGAADVVSVFVRQSLVQIVTPEYMRGRVSAVASLFISASNELGEFESGVTARWLGPVLAAACGGIGSILITFSWAKLFPALRKADRLIAAEE